MGGFLSFNLQQAQPEENDLIIDVPTIAACFMMRRLGIIFLFLIKEHRINVFLFFTKEFSLFACKMFGKWL